MTTSETTTVPVIWWTANPASINRGYWDQALLEGILDRSVWRPPCPLEFDHRMVEDVGQVWFSTVARSVVMEGAVIVVPGGHNAAPEYVERLRTLVQALDWSVVIVTGDEERLFPLAELDDAGAVWVTCARGEPPLYEEAIGFGWQPSVHAAIVNRDEPFELVYEVSFAGQVTHERRQDLAAAMANIPARGWVSTRTFGGQASDSPEGLTPQGYATMLMQTRVAPAPSGPVVPDSFRLFEALEAGALPIADSRTPVRNEPNYWDEVCGGEPPFPVVSEWGRLHALVNEAQEQWPGNVNRAGSWWQQRKRYLACELDRTIRRVGGPKAEPRDLAIDNEITVVITTSPSPVHPSIEHTWAVVESVREQLPDAEILIAADGVRPELEHRRADYEHYLRNLIWSAGRSHNVAVLRYDEWRHQALTLRAALAEVTTDFVLVMEHDTPMVGPRIWWNEVGYLLHDGSADLVRFHHESHVLEPHEHLMLGEVDGTDFVRMRRTVQWSQRPHLTRTLWYRSLLDTYFGTESRTMVEDAMHGVVDYHWRTYGEAGWEQFRLWLYHEEDDGGSIQRSTHLDGRGSDNKFDMLYAYDGAQPAGAPAPTWGRR